MTANDGRLLKAVLQGW